MELSKAFDSIKHDLLKDNFYAYGFIISKYGFSIIISVINDTGKKWVYGKGLFKECRKDLFLVPFL